MESSSANTNTTTTATNNTTTSASTIASSSQERPEWEAFVRHGACLKSFLSEALQRFKHAATTPTFPTHHPHTPTPNSRATEGNHATTSETRDDNNYSNTHQETDPTRSATFSSQEAEELARDKIAECMILERVRALFSMCMIVFFQ
jgi:hypothetical protein